MHAHTLHVIVYIAEEYIFSALLSRFVLLIAQDHIFINFRRCFTFVLPSDQIIEKITMESLTSTDDLNVELKTVQDNILLEMINELSTELDSKLSSKLKGKVNRIVADCDLSHHTSLHKLSTADESTSTLLGFMNHTPAELTYDEQAELNQAINNKIQSKLLTYTTDLEHLRQSAIKKESNKGQVNELRENLDQKLNTLRQQENEKVELMLEWLNHRIYDLGSFNDNSSELLTLKTRILDLKSKILHLQIMQNIFTETNQSVKAYSEIQKDLKERIKETEQRIKSYREIIDSDNRKY